MGNSASALETSQVYMPSRRREYISQFKLTRSDITEFYELKSKRNGNGEYDIVVREMQNSIQRHNNCENGGGCFSSYNNIRVFKLHNTKLWRKYIARRNYFIAKYGYADERMLFHGSHSSLAICLTGFDLSYANKDSLFGAAIYFAEDSSKSNQYSYGFMGGDGCSEHRDKNCRICTRSMLFCRVALGKMNRVVFSSDPNAKELVKGQPAGYDSIKCDPSPEGVQFPEYAIYEEDQIYPEYLIHYTIE